MAKKEPLYPHVPGGRGKVSQESEMPKGRLVPSVNAVEYGTISAFQKRTDLVLVTDSQDTEAIKEDFGHRPAVERFDGFFVKVGEGEYTEVYGFEGIVPELWKPVYKITRYYRTVRR